MGMAALAFLINGNGPPRMKRGGPS